MMPQAAGTRGKLIFQVIVPVIVITLLSAGLQMAVTFFLLRFLNSEIKSGIRSEFEQTSGDFTSGLREQGILVLKHNSEAVLSQQLQYLETQKHKFNNASELAAFCIADQEFQKLALRSFGRYGYTNASVKVDGRLICVAHAKKEIVGCDLFAVVASLSADARQKQNVDEFVKNWSMHVSGVIDFEQTDTFLPVHIPASVGRRKIAYQVWSEIAGIPVVAETTTYLAEFLEPADRVMSQHNRAVSNIESKIVRGLTSWLTGSLILVLFSLVAVVLTSVWNNRRKVQKPLEVISEGLTRFGAGDFSARINCQANNELGLVAEISNKMADHLADSLSSLEEARKDLEAKVTARTADLEKANQALEAERQTAERLLLNTLPAPVARRLRAGEETLVDDFALATVLFTDFKGFTQLTETVTPSRLVSSLNEVFAKFDEFAAELGIEKIKTIGDAYMAVGGVPVRDDRHPEKVVELGLRMRDYIAQRLENKDLLPFQIRIGIHSGPVLAGVIGRSKMTYDLWGDTVNIASRCESASEPMRVNISEATYKLVKDRFKCEYRGLVAAKGKGEMPMYFVERLN
ncbi:MAG TPA: adenylate/guanylate cyclase domain-containing protein [Candidatus Rifleibacterium sp.]|nr:adenylate/guanylate cyclase domain-containing protein [Candidatus Rifleibacterium sp.]